MADLSLEQENGRLFRLMAKLDFINERPEGDMVRQLFCAWGFAEGDGYAVLVEYLPHLLDMELLGDLLCSWSAGYLLCETLSDLDSTGSLECDCITPTLFGPLTRF